MMWMKATLSSVDECETEFEIVGTEPIELARVDGDKLDEEDDEILDHEEEDE